MYSHLFAAQQFKLTHLSTIDLVSILISKSTWYTMAQSFCYTIIGDSNIRRFVTLVNRRACPDLEDAQILVCGRLALLADALNEIRSSTNLCLVTCITNFLTASTGSGSAALRVEPALIDFKSRIIDACSQRPDTRFLVYPPMYRSSPLWYRDGLPEVLKKFSTIMSGDASTLPNLSLMPSFSSPSFEDDGVHLTPYSGLEFIYFLFDSSKEAIRLSSLDTASRSSLGHESTRLLEDQMMAIEQDHRRLNTSFELKSAVDAERDDFQENVRNEVFFMVTGLTPIHGLKGKDWMDKAISDVQGVILTLLGKELPIVVVHNASGRGRDALVRYSVKMQYAADSQEIRSKFGAFFVGGQDRRPPALKSVSISNKVTPGTQVRIMILKLLGKRYSTSNPGAKVKVVGYEPRPMLKITPPENSSDRRVRNYTYIDAIKKLPVNFSSAELRPIIAKARVHFPGALRSTFAVLSDDALVPRRDRTQPSSASAAADEATTEASELSDAEPESESLADVSVRPGAGGRKRPAPPASLPGSQRSRH